MHETSIGLIAIFVAFAGAKLFGYLAERLRLPALIGEVLAGIVLGPALLSLIHDSPLLEALSTLGAIVLLFSTGLEVQIDELRSTGKASILTAILGIALPFALIYSVASLFYSSTPSLYVAVAGVATSIGITARVLSEKGVLSTKLARTILGAAIIDDILGIALLALIASLTRSGKVSGAELAIVLGQVVAFLVLALVFVRKLVSFHGSRAEPKSSGTFSFAVAVMLGLSALSEYFGLAAIIGSFFAGSIFAESRSSREIVKKTKPLATLLVPFFLVSVGLKVSPDALRNASLLLPVLTITVAAIVGKVLGGVLATRSEGKAFSWAVGIGIVPRGEVGLLIAGLGASDGILGGNEVSVIVAMSLLTTVFTPLALPYFLRKDGAAGKRLA